MGAEKQGVFLQESLVFSHLHIPEASCPFLLESSGVSAVESLWIYSGSTAGLEAFSICECVGWNCVWGADSPEQDASAAGGQESTAVSN